MAKLRPGKCYRKIERAYTRQSTRKPRMSYVKGVPKPKIAQYEMGINKDYGAKIFLVPEQSLQIRNNSLEAARMAATKHIEKNCKEFFVKLRLYPFHVIRENPLATGAGADRFQQGMRQSFGKPIGTAIQVRAGQKIFEIRVPKESIGIAKVAMKRAIHKLPMKYKIIIE